MTDLKSTLKITLVVVAFAAIVGAVGWVRWITNERARLQAQVVELNADLEAATRERAVTEKVITRYVTVTKSIHQAATEAALAIPQAVPAGTPDLPVDVRRLLDAAAGHPTDAERGPDGPAAAAGEAAR